MFAYPYEARFMVNGQSYTFTVHAFNQLDANCEAMRRLRAVVGDVPYSSIVQYGAVRDEYMVQLTRQLRRERREAEKAERQAARQAAKAARQQARQAPVFVLTAPVVAEQGVFAW